MGALRHQGGHRAEVGDANVDLGRRVDRLESTEAIRQLPPKYCIALDQRDWDLLVNLFVEDVGVPGSQRGRLALKEWYDRTVRKATLATAHLTANHIVEFEDPDHAVGLVYSRNEIEVEAHWMFEMMLYLDRYERRDGRWFFFQRTPVFWYQADSREMPFGPEDKLRWPGRPAQPESWHPAFPSWQDFLQDPDGYGRRAVPDPPEEDGFLAALRRGAGRPRVNPSGAMYMSKFDESPDPGRGPEPA